MTSDQQPVGPPLWAVLVITIGVAVLVCGIVVVVVTVANSGPVPVCRTPYG
jgi:hypothetical protein